MASDFTLITYRLLLESALNAGYKPYTFRDFVLANPSEKAIIFRHDVDKSPANSLATAQIEAELNIKGTYYFRIVPESFDSSIIKKIELLGHEIGYHYEDPTLCKGDLEKAIQHFENALKQLRNEATINTICMHGSPMTKWDNKDLWKNKDYKSYDIIAEPYFDLDFSKVLYLTDTGRNWRNRGSVRDNVESPFNFQFETTYDIIKAFEKGKLPDQIMINFHPQRWTNNKLSWTKELIMQNLKNIVKSAIR